MAPALALGVTAWAALLAGLQARRASGPGTDVLLRFCPPGRWALVPAPPPPDAAARDPVSPRTLQAGLPVRLRAGWCFGSGLAALEWQLPDGKLLVAVLGPGDLDEDGWRRLRVCLAHARRGGDS